MKWYDSIKVKLIGFFVVVSIFFLIFIMASFSMLKESQVEKSAIEQASLSTIRIVEKMTNTKVKIEESVSILASIAAQKYENAMFDSEFILAFLNAMRDEHVPSGGIWLDPSVADESKEDAVIFFGKDEATGRFRLIEHYTPGRGHDYTQMEFYAIGKELQKGNTFWTKVYTDPVTHVRMITVVSPIYKGKRFIGVASIDMNVGHYMEKLKAYSDRYMMIIDRSGTFIAKSPLVRSVFKENNIYHIEDPRFASVVEAIESNIDKRKERIGKPCKEMAEALAERSYEIDRKDAEIIASIMQAHARAIETETYFIEDDALLGKDSVLAVFYFTDTGMSLIVGMSEDAVLEDVNAHYRMMLWITFISTLLATLFGYLLLKRYFVEPLESVNAQIENSLQDDGHYRFLQCDDKGEIGQLVYNLNYRTLALEDAQRREKEETQKRLANEKLLIQQSKMAAMGEMMDAVAHQWKQPLNALSMYSEIIKSDFEEGSVDQKYIDEFSRNIQIQIDHMVSTLDEFRSFFRPNKSNEDFTVSEVIDSVLFLTKDEFMKHRIRISVENEHEIALQGSKNEFKHLILNIINNAKDAFNDNGIEEKREIIIRLLDGEKGRRIEIEDNAGGIPEDVLPEIFKANVTTKAEGKGTGIGLYMSTQIAEKYHARLMVENVNGGARFTILFDV